MTGSKSSSILVSCVLVSCPLSKRGMNIDRQKKRKKKRKKYIYTVYIVYTLYTGQKF